MSLSSQFNALVRQTSAMLAEMFPARGVMVSDVQESGDNDFACFYSPVKAAQQMQAFGFRSDFNLLLHVSKTETNFVPEIGRNVNLYSVKDDGTLGDLIVTARLVRLRVHPAGGDHVVECKSQW